MQERIVKFEELLEKELKEELDKIIAAGTITPENLHTVKDAVKLMLKIQKYKEWMMGEGESSYDGYSNRRGRSATTGRYVSRNSGPDSYSRGMSHTDEYSGRRSYRGSYDNGYSSHNRMIDQLERMYDEAKNERERHMIEEWINNAEMNG